MNYPTSETQQRLFITKDLKDLEIEVTSLIELVMRHKDRIEGFTRAGAPFKIPYQPLLDLRLEISRLQWKLDMQKALGVFYFESLNTGVQDQKSCLETWKLSMLEHLK